jgi:hypothetical protein
VALPAPARRPAGAATGFHVAGRPRITFSFAALLKRV